MELVFAGLPHVLEADAKQIAKVARETLDMYVLYVFFLNGLLGNLWGIIHAM